MIPALTPEQTAVLGVLGSAFVTGIFLLITTLVSRTTRTPAEKDQANTAANELILKLLDRADKTIESKDETIKTLETAKAALESQVAKYPGVEQLQTALADVTARLEHVTDELDEAVRERDRLLQAIERIKDHARTRGSVTYDEVVMWANNALDLDVHLYDHLPVPMSPDIEQTVRPMRSTK